MTTTSAEAIMLPVNARWSCPCQPALLAGRTLLLLQNEVLLEYRPITRQFEKHVFVFHVGYHADRRRVAYAEDSAHRDVRAYASHRAGATRRRVHQWPSRLGRRRGRRARALWRHL